MLKSQWMKNLKTEHHIDGLAQDCSNSIANKGVGGAVRFLVVGTIG